MRFIAGGGEIYLLRVLGIILVIAECFMIRPSFGRFYFQMRKRDDRHLYTERRRESFGMLLEAFKAEPDTPENRKVVEEYRKALEEA